MKNDTVNNEIKTKYKKGNKYMSEKTIEEKIEKLLKETLKQDRAKTQVEGFTKLDLMEMTRKHICSHKE